MTIRALLFSASLFLITATCNPKEKSFDFDYGKVEDNQYTNDYFHFSMKIPQAWVVQDKAQAAAQKRGEEVIAGHDENTKAIMKASEVNVATLLVTSKYAPGAAVEFNPTIVIVVENIQSAPGVKNGGDYLFHTRALLQQSQLHYSHLDENFETAKIGSREFHFMNGIRDLMGRQIKQRYYATIIDGFSFVATITYGTEEQLKELTGILETASFGN